MKHSVFHDVQSIHCLITESIHEGAKIVFCNTRVTDVTTGFRYKIAFLPVFHPIQRMQRKTRAYKFWLACESINTKTRKASDVRARMQRLFACVAMCENRSLLAYVVRGFYTVVRLWCAVLCIRRTYNTIQNVFEQILM